MGPSRSAAPIAVALIVMVAWGATPVATQIALGGLDPLAVALLRTVLAGAAAVPVALALRVPLPRGRRAWFLLGLASFAGFVGFPLVYCFAQDMTSASHGSLVMACLPVLTGLYAAGLERRFPGLAWLVGCTLSLGGEALLITARDPGAGEASLVGDALILLVSMLVAVGYVAGARLGQLGYPSLGTTLWGVALAALPMGLGLCVLGFVQGPPHAGAEAWGSIAWLACVTSILGYLGWYWALARGGIARIATIQFLQPLSGLALAVALLDEQPTLLTLGAAVPIILGVVIVQRRRASRR